MWEREWSREGGDGREREGRGWGREREGEGWKENVKISLPLRRLSNYDTSLIKTPLPLGHLTN